MGLTTILGTVGGFGGGLLRLRFHSDPCPRHCDSCSRAHGAAAFSDPYSTHDYPSPNISPDTNGARCHSYTGPP